MSRGYPVPVYQYIRMLNCSSLISLLYSWSMLFNRILKELTIEQNKLINVTIMPRQSICRPDIVLTYFSTKSLAVDIFKATKFTFSR